jgi:hypothetical protein
MTTATAELETTTAPSTERQEIHQRIDTLSDSAFERLAHYIEFLRYEDRIEELEDAEDIAYIEAHKDEGPNVPLSEVVAKYEAEYGPLS